MNLLRNAWLRFEDPLVHLGRARNRLYSLWLKATYPFASTGSRLSVHYPCSFRRWTTDQIKLGDDVIIGKDSTLYVVKDHVTGVKLAIDDNCAIGARSVISARNLIHIEKNVIMGTSVLIQDHHHTHEIVDLPIRDQGITAGGRIRIEEGCWIGQGAAIVCNEGEIVIGRNSVVGANSVVGRSVPPCSVVIGNPGIIVRHADPARARLVSEAGRASAPRSLSARAKEAGDGGLVESRRVAGDML
jgi:acetyltransferase-like isoleucine patch superfamily enzyme